MSEAVQVRYSWRDHRALLLQMARAQNEFRMGLGPSIRWAGWALASTLGTSTRVSKKTRSIMKLPRRGYKKGERVAGASPFNVHADKGRSSWNRVIWRKSISEVKKSPLATIKLSGLAKSAWMWNIKRLGKGQGQGFASPEARAKAVSLAGVEEALKGDNPFIKMRSRVHYAEAAVQGGKQSIDTAMGRASRLLAHQIDAKLAKTLLQKRAA